MEWVQSLNRAIGYMEDHLLEGITCEEIAAHVYISNYHFQRCFRLLTGMTVGEYIRNRRLSLAGQELLASDEKVIDAALKYGYETPESFTKAFTRFHGVTPTQAKQEGSELKSFNRLLIKIKLEGGTVMDYRIITKSEFQILALTRTFQSENSNRDLPRFWTEYFTKGYAQTVDGTFGVCRQESLDSVDFQYSIGCEYSQGMCIPEGFGVITIPASTWAVFKSVGPMPDAIQDVWKRIYSEWLPQAEYDRIQEYDFEKYTSGNNQAKDYISEVWIPIKRK